jgi:HK97 gp10 family phage protein
MTAIRTTGGKELAAFLNALPKNLRNNALKAALTAAAGVIRDEARLQVSDNTKTGTLRRGIKTGRPRVEQDGSASVRVRVTGRHRHVAHWLEYGVLPHVISVRDGDGNLKIGKNFVGKEVEHPGFIAKPFMRPALDSKAQEAINAFGARIRDYLSQKTGITTAMPFQVDDEGY